MIAEISILPAIRSLYDAVTDAGKWPAFLKELAACFGGNGAHFLRVQPQAQALSFSALYGYDDVILNHYGGDAGADLGTALRVYERHFTELIPTDPRVKWLERYPSRPLSCRMRITDAQMHGSRIYQDMLQLADIEYTLAVSLPEDDGSLIMLGVFRGRQSRFFNEREVELFGELIPHLKQAVALSEHLARVDFANHAALEALDSIAMGVLVVDERARVIHANVTAERVLTLDDGISLQNGILRLHGRDDDASLRQAILEAVANAGAETIPSGQALIAPRPSGNDPFPLLVGTLWGNHLRYGLARLDRPLAVVFVTIPEEPQEASAELLRRLFGLTAAEARVCERLVGGATVDEIARALGIGVETVRTHLKSIFAKTGVGRQAELVARIMATPLWMRHSSRNKDAPPAN
jgi:DNA-binding CsgD family transcriptional regulator/PAS domain-containing protein